MEHTGAQYFRPAEISGLEVLTCSDVNFHFKPHFHDSYCIWLNSSSAETYNHQGNSGILQPGDIGIIAPGEVHANSAFEAGSRQLLTFYLDSDQLQKISAEILGSSGSAVEFRTSFITDIEVSASLVALQQVLEISTKSSLMRQSTFYNVLSQLVCRYATPFVQELTIGREQQRISKIIEQFHDQLDEDIRLDELAQIVNCTPYYLIRFFKKSVGMTPHAYLLQLRLEKARNLLQQGQSIVSAAIDSGFTDQSHLTRHFKLKFGTTPGTYRRQILMIK